MNTFNVGDTVTWAKVVWHGGSSFGYEPYPGTVLAIKGDQVCVLGDDGIERVMPWYYVVRTPALTTLVDADDYDACAQQASYAGALE